MYKIEYNDELAQQHYRNVGQVIKGLAKIFIEGKSRKLDGVNYTATDKTKNYLSKLMDEVYLCELITGRPEKLCEIIQEMPEEALKVPSKDAKRLEQDFNLNRILYYIFIKKTYEETKYLNKNQFIKALGIKTCPYCNRNFIFVVEKSKSGKIVKPAIDHFFPKSKYPFLGVSYYNLIPACGMCNGLDCKCDESPCTDDRDPQHSLRIMNPYEFNDADFRFSFDCLKHELFNLQIEDIRINILGKPELVQGYEDLFALERLYSEHIDYVMDIINKLIYQYNDSSRYYLANSIDEKIPEHELIQAFWGFSINRTEARNRIFTKFFNDILEKAKEYKAKRV